jgi:hypothetical protein
VRYLKEKAGNQTKMKKKMKEKIAQQCHTWIIAPEWISEISEGISLA